MRFSALTSKTFLIFVLWVPLTLALPVLGEDKSSSCETLLKLNHPLLAQYLKAVERENSKLPQSPPTPEQVRFLVAEYVLNKGVLPDPLQIPSLISRSQAYKNTYASLSPEVQQALTNEILASALKKHKGAREALVKKLSLHLIRHFNKDLTLPSFSHLAQSVNSNATDLTFLLYGEQAGKDKKGKLKVKKGYKLLIEEIETHQSEAFDRIREQIINIYAKKAQASGRTLSLRQLYNGLIHARPDIQSHFTLNHLAYLVGEEMPLKGESIQKPYIHLFSSLEEIYQLAYRIKPSAFDKVLDKYTHNRESQQKIIELIRQKPRMILTSAAPGVEIHEEAFAALIKIAEAQQAFIVVFAEAGQPARLDPLLLNHPLVHIIHDSIEVSPWLKLNTLPLHFKRLDPNSPLRQPGRGGQRGQTQIVGHPQLRDEYLPTNDNHLFPHRIITTGAITKAWYAAKKPIGGVTDNQARDVHAIGALILEKDRMDSGLDGLGTPNTWHSRHLEWSPHSKSFTDKGTRYSFREDWPLQRFRPVPKDENLRRLKDLEIEPHLDDSLKHEKVLMSFMQKKLLATSVRPEYLVIGDKHIGGEDHYAFSQVELEALKKFNPKRVVLHDLFDGKSINHWESKDMLIMAKKAAAGELFLQDELDKVTAYVNQLLVLNPELTVVVVESNHYNWLVRLLKETRELSQPINDPLVHELIHAALNMDINPLEYYMAKRAEIIRRDPNRKYREGYVTELVDSSRVQFLPKGSSLKAGPMDFSIEIGEHGHNGGGMRGTGITLRTTAGRSYTGIVYGHTHSPGRANRSGNAGASISPRQDYSLGGASATGMAFVAVYDDGTFQVHIFDHNSQSYELGEGHEPLPPEEFFYSLNGQEWPRLIEHEEKEKNIDTLDQWRGFNSPNEVNERYHSLD